MVLDGVARLYIQYDHLSAMLQDSYENMIYEFEQCENLGGPVEWNDWDHPNLQELIEAVAYFFNICGDFHPVYCELQAAYKQMGELHPEDKENLYYKIQM